MSKELNKARLEIIDGMLKDNTDLRKVLYELYEDDIIEYVLASGEYIHRDEASEYVDPPDHSWRD